MRRVAMFLSGLLLVSFSNGQALAKDQRTYDQIQAAKQQAQEERAKRKEAQSGSGQVQSGLAQSDKAVPLIPFHRSAHSRSDVSWLYGKRRKGY